MVRSHVTRAELQNDNIVLSVLLEGFDQGETVELTGSVVQNGSGTQNGAFAIVNSIQTIDYKDFESDAELTVDVPAKGFNPGEDLTVVMQAAKVWMTMLTEDEAAKSKGLTAWNAHYSADQAGQGTTWTPGGAPG
jgi:hypothetical protein